MTLYKLGVTRLWRVFFYRLKCRFGWFVKHYPAFSWPWRESPAFWGNHQLVVRPALNDRLVRQVDQYRQGQWLYYFHHWFRHVDDSLVPSWFLNPFNRRMWAQENKHWSCLNYFACDGDDIKNIWELSRFYWAPQFAYAASVTGEPVYLDNLNKLLSSWCQENAPNQGYQWLCAQEASIRLINVILTDFILQKASLTPALAIFVEAHISRILPTLSYAKAQANNHATTEAAALYVSGLWLMQHAQTASQKKLANTALRKGKRSLEALAVELIMDDGTFSQYSVTYHRILLDTLNIAVFFQRHFEATPFKASFQKKYRLAYQWLLSITDSTNGAAPNLGSNDGALLFKLDTCDYRDFRPSLQLASVLLFGRKVFDADGEYDRVLKILGLLDKLTEVSVKGEENNDLRSLFSDGGLKIFKQKNYRVFLRFPRFRFRPCQCDSLHVDFWLKGENILMDSGTFSYNPKRKEQNLKWTRNHNTIQLDAYEQMPSIGRFLFSAWPRAKILLNQPNKFSVSVKYLWGYNHQRTIEVRDHACILLDYVQLRRSKAGTLRWFWHLLPGDWLVCNNKLIDHNRQIEMVFCLLEGDPVEVVLSSDEHSLYYQQAEQHPCAVITLPISAKEGVTLKTEIRVLS